MPLFAAAAPVDNISLPDDFREEIGRFFGGMFLGIVKMVEINPTLRYNGVLLFCDNGYFLYLCGVNMNRTILRNNDYEKNSLLYPSLDMVSHVIAAILGAIWRERFSLSDSISVVGLPQEIGT